MYQQLHPHLEAAHKIFREDAKEFIARVESGSSSAGNNALAVSLASAAAASTSSSKYYHSKSCNIMPASI